MKKTPLLMFILISSLLCACAQPDPKVLEEASRAESAQTMDIADTSASAGEASIPSGDGISIAETIGEGDYVFTIDAVVHVPDTIPQEGTLVTKNMDISLIEQYLCDGEKLHENPAPSDPSVIQYISDGNQVVNDLSFDMHYTVNTLSPGSAGFNNYRLDEAYTSSDMMILTSDQQSSEDQAFITEMENSATTLLDNLSVEGIINATWFNTDGAKKYCMINVIPCLNGYPLLADAGNFCLTSINIGEQGINVINFKGLFDISEASDVQVLSIDDIMNKVRTGVAEKNINTYPQPVTDIRLAYLTVSEDNKTVNFYPVWIFSGTIDEMTGLVPFLCLDARTGETVSMMQTY